MNIDRREFLQTGALTSGAMGLGMLGSLFFPRQLLADGHGKDKKLLFIFQRGGNDGINSVVPRGDKEYNTNNRPTLFLPENQTLDLGNGFAQFHPALEPMMDIYNHTKLTGKEGPGNLAVIHRIGYSNQSRSHFNSQQYWENGTPGKNKLEEGMFYRQLATTMDLNDRKNAFVAAGLSGSQLVAFKGGKPIPNFRKAEDFTFNGSSAKSAKFLGILPERDQRWPDGSGLLGLYGSHPTMARKPYRDRVHSTGQLLGATMETLQNAVRKGSYSPSNGASYPNGTFGNRLQEAAMLFKRTPAKMMGLNIGGWDTHSKQGQLYGKHANLLGQVAQGFQALYQDLQDQWDKLVIVTMTEFGRTSKENGGRGTDHAEATVMFVAGGGVKGGVYNCDSNTWKNGDMFSRKDRYLARKTDYRSVFGEIFTHHFGNTQEQIQKVIPSYAEARAKNKSDFKALKFLA